MRNAPAGDKFKPSKARKMTLNIRYGNGVLIVVLWEVTTLTEYAMYFRRRRTVIAFQNWNLIREESLKCNQQSRFWIESEKFKGQQRGNLHKALPLSIKTRSVLSCVQKPLRQQGCGNKRREWRYGWRIQQGKSWSDHQSLADGTYTPNPVRRKYIQKKQNSTKTSSWNSYLYGQAGAGSIENDIGIGLRANLLKQFSWLSSQQELPHCAEIFEKRIFRCVVVYWGRY